MRDNKRSVKGRHRQFWSESENLGYPCSIHNPWKMFQTIWYWFINQFVNLFNENFATPIVLWWHSYNKKFSVQEDQFYCKFCKSIPYGLKHVKNTKPPTCWWRFWLFCDVEDINTSYHTKYDQILSMNVACNQKCPIVSKCRPPPPIYLQNDW